ncbi:MAG TPA: DUF2269 family protein [Gemmatimonadaceae bacterium]|nr:DUF2269 family protein [Gemmatimonadaceae bacterium]
MPMLYSILKFLHVSAVIIWLGAIITLAVLFVRLARERESGALQLLARQSEFVGKALIGPSAGVTLLAGGALVWQMGIGMPAWTWWGLIGFVVSVTLGAGVMQRVGRKLSTVAASPNPDAAVMDGLQRRLRTLGIINIVILLSVVWAMVAKPTF